MSKERNKGKGEQGELEEAVLSKFTGGKVGVLATHSRILAWRMAWTEEPHEVAKSWTRLTLSLSGVQGSDGFSLAEPQHFSGWAVAEQGEILP